MLEKETKYSYIAFPMSFKFLLNRFSYSVYDNTKSANSSILYLVPCTDDYIWTKTVKQYPLSRTGSYFHNFLPRQNTSAKNK